MKTNKIYLILVILLMGALVFYGIKIDRKLNKPCECREAVEYLDPIVREPNTYQDFLIEALKTNRSPECNLLFDDCLGLMGMEK